MHPPITCSRLFYLQTEQTTIPPVTNNQHQLPVVSLHSNTVVSGCACTDYQICGLFLSLSSLFLLSSTENCHQCGPTSFNSHSTTHHRRSVNCVSCSVTLTVSVLLSLAAFSESDFSLSLLCISCFSSGVSEQMIPTLTPSSLVPSGNYFMSMYLIYIFVIYS